MNISYDELQVAVAQAVEEALEKILIKYGVIQNMDKPKPVMYVPLKVVCDQLSISKTTLHNWRKDSRLKNLLEPHIKTTGKKVYFDLEGLKKTLREDGIYFSNGRDYKFREEILTKEEKKMRAIAEINSKIEYEQKISDEEKDFLKEYSPDDAIYFDEKMPNSRKRR